MFFWTFSCFTVFSTVHISSPTRGELLICKKEAQEAIPLEFEAYKLIKVRLVTFSLEKKLEKLPLLNNYLITLS